MEISLQKWFFNNWFRVQVWGFRVGVEGIKLNDRDRCHIWDPRVRRQIGDGNE